MAGIAALTDRNAVLKAMTDYDRLGRDAFLDHHRFGRAKWWYVLNDGKQYDSKAIVGAAIGYQTGNPLTTNDFGGGEETVVRKLRALRFEVVRHEITEESSRLPEEVPETFPEGMRTTVTVNRAERSAKARLACITIHGTACSVCRMNFEDVYGLEFAGLIHVHHLAPLGGTSDVTLVNPETDLRPVCPNCHAAIHYGGVNRSLEDVQSSLTRSSAPAV
jgi:5-methylcytosine-specific restriction protein A